MHNRAASVCAPAAESAAEISCRAAIAERGQRAQRTDVCARSQSVAVYRESSLCGVRWQWSRETAASAAAAARSEFELADCRLSGFAGVVAVVTVCRANAVARFSDERVECWRLAVRWGVESRVGQTGAIPHRRRAVSANSAFSSFSADFSRRVFCSYSFGTVTQMFQFSISCTPRRA